MPGPGAGMQTAARHMVAYTIKLNNKRKKYNPKPYVFPDKVNLMLDDIPEEEFLYKGNTACAGCSAMLALRYILKAPGRIRSS